jgi:hypothetical protein
MLALEAEGFFFRADERQVLSFKFNDQDRAVQGTQTAPAAEFLINDK